MPEEIWKPVVGYPHYEVSSLGRVRSKKGILRAFWHGRYLKVSISHGPGFTQMFVHILVLEAFVGKRPTFEHEAHHRSKDRSDNSVENLEWLHFRAHGAAHRKIDPDTAEEIRRRYWELRDMTIRKLAREYGVGEATIHRIIHRRSG
jgi:NUMOD4 motif/HNH endonuclease